MNKQFKSTASGDCHPDLKCSYILSNPTSCYGYEGGDYPDGGEKCFSVSGFGYGEICGSGSISCTGHDEDKV